MMLLTDNDEKILKNYLLSYKECFEAMNDLLVSIMPRIVLTDEEITLSKISDMKFKNMIYHIRKWDPKFKKFTI